MKHTIFKLALLSLFQVIGFSFLAQQKDSLAATPFEVKEDLNAKRTRKYFYFVSTRLSDDDKYDIFKTTPGTPPALIVIRGHFEIIGNPNEKKAKISIYNSSNNELVGVYNTNAYTGNYLLILAPNLKYQFKVEATGYGTSQETVEIPLSTSCVPNFLVISFTSIILYFL